VKVCYFSSINQLFPRNSEFKTSASHRHLIAHCRQSGLIGGYYSKVIDIYFFSEASTLFFFVLSVVQTQVNKMEIGGRWLIAPKRQLEWVAINAWER
jgi:hypothetical protein